MAQPPLVRPDAPFSEALRVAIKTRKVTLAGLRERLEVQGNPVGLATLSSWQSGTRLPRQSSLETIAAIEDVLEVPRNWLGQRVSAPPPEFGAANARQLRATLARGEFVRSTLASTPAYGDTRDLSLVDRLELDENGSIHRMRILRLVQALQPTDRVVMAQLGEAGTSSADVQINLLAGAQELEMTRSEEHPLAIGTLHLGRRIEVGETALVEVDVRDSSTTRPIEVSRYLDSDDTTYLLEVTFRPERLPERIVSFQAARSDSKRIRHPLSLSRDQRVHLMHHGGQVSVAGIAWTWPKG